MSNKVKHEVEELFNQVKRTHLGDQTLYNRLISDKIESETKLESNRKNGFKISFYKRFEENQAEFLQYRLSRFF